MVTEFGVLMNITLLILLQRKQKISKDFRNKLIHYYHTRSAHNGMLIYKHGWRPNYMNVR